MTGKGRVLLLLIVATLIVGLPPVAQAFWPATGRAGSTVTTGRLAGPTSLAVPSISYSSSVQVSWSSGPGLAPDGYWVQRLGSRPGPACGTSPTAPIPSTSCVDTVPGDGDYSYQVVAVRGSWSAAAISAPTTVRLPVTAVFCQQPTTAAAGNALTPPVRLCLRTAGGDPAPAGGIPLTVHLGGTSTGQLQGTLTAATDSSGTAVLDSLRVDQAGTDFRLTVSGPGLVDATSDRFAIVPATADVLVFGTPARTATAATSSDGQPIVIRRDDPFGNPVTAGTTTVRLATSSGGTTRFSTTPGGAAVTTATIATGTSSTTVYYADTRAGRPVVTVSAAGLVSASQEELITPAAASTLAYSTAAPTFTVDAAARYGPLTVVRRDAYGNAAPVTAATAVTLTATGSSTTVFAAVPSGSATGSVTMAAGTSSVDFWIGDIRPGKPVLVAAMAGLTTASQTATITVGSAVALVVTSAARTGTASTTASIGPLTVQQQDVYGNAVAAPAAGLVVSLKSSSTGARFATRSGGGAVTSVTMTSGTTSVNAYYGDTVAGGPTVTATATGLTAATQTVTIAPASVRKLVFVNAAISAAPSASRTVGPLTLQRQDTYGNPTTSGSTTVALTTGNTTTGSFAATPGGAATTTVTIAAGSSTATAWYGDTRTGTIRLGALATNLTTAAQNIVLTAVPSRLVITSTARSGAASATATMGAVVISRQDQFGNAAPAPTGGAVISLSSTTTGTPVFATAAGGTPVSQVTMAAGASTVSVYYGDTRVGTPVITASAAGITPATQAQTITPGTTRNLAVLSPPLSGSRSASAQLGPLVVARVDAFGNQVTNSTSALTIGLTSTSTGRRFATTAGGTAVTSAQIPAGQATVSVYYGDSVAGSPVITVSASGLPSVTQTATIGP